MQSIPFLPVASTFYNEQYSTSNFTNF